MAATALSISLITGAFNAVSANSDLKLKEGNEGNEMSPVTIKDTLTWELDGNVVDPTSTYSVTIGNPNIKLYAKNTKKTGSPSFRVEVMHSTKKRVIFNETVAAGESVEIVNNDRYPLVPSGTYIVTIYGGAGMPKGEVVLESSDTKWP